MQNQLLSQTFRAYLGKMMANYLMSFLGTIVDGIVISRWGESDGDGKPTYVYKKANRSDVSLCKTYHPCYLQEVVIRPDIQLRRTIHESNHILLHLIDIGSCKSFAQQLHKLIFGNFLPAKLTDALLKVRKV